MMRRFLPTFLRTLDFDATPGGRPTLEAVQFLQQVEGRPRASMQDAPRSIIPRSWQRYVLPRSNRPQELGCEEPQVHRPAYTVCVVERLHEALRRHDVFVEPSEHWGDPRAKLLQGEQWENVRIQVCRTLGREVAPEQELARLQRLLDEAYRRTVDHLPTNTAVHIEQRDGQDTFNLDRLERQEESEQLRTLREQVRNRVPLVELPEVILEVERHTGFAPAFTHVSESNARVQDLSLSVCAVLLTEACNIGLTP